MGLSMKKDSTAKFWGVMGRDNQETENHAELKSLMYKMKVRIFLRAIFVNSYYRGAMKNNH